MGKVIKLIERYNPNNIDQEFMDLEFARLDHEEKMQNEFIKEALTKEILKQPVCDCKCHIENTACAVKGHICNNCRGLTGQGITWGL